MSRSLHWTLILGCASLTVLYAQPAWEALTTGVPRAVAAARSITAGAPEAESSVPASELLGLIPDLEDAGAEPGPVIVGRS